MCFEEKGVIIKKIIFSFSSVFQETDSHLFQQVLCKTIIFRNSYQGFFLESSQVLECTILKPNHLILN